MKLNRRDWLQLTGWMGVAVSTNACGDDDIAFEPLPEYEYGGDLGPGDLFQHGVASGDPLNDAIVIWTRVTPESDGMLDVWFELATDPDFANRVTVGWFTTQANIDYTVKVDVRELNPGETYYYRFFCLGRESATGRAKTAPEGAVDRLRFGVTSCASIGHGYFHAYRALAAANDLDAVIHLGDYIYEYGTGDYGSIRECEPAHEIITLSDYRMRYAQYRRDADLQAMHKQHALIPVWDDHESSNNAWTGGASGHDPETEGAWSDRLDAARRAYWEWMPIREAEVVGRLWRSLQYGDLVHLLMLDTRNWGRDEQGGDGDDRQLLGDDQEAWLSEQMTASTQQWCILGQQVMLGKLAAGGTPINDDQWDGYEGAKARLYEMMDSSGRDNFVVLTGDIHSSWAIECAPDDAEYDPETGAGARAVEFVTPGVSSPGLPPGLEVLIPLIFEQNPHIKWLDTVRRGYILLDVTPDRVQADWFHYTEVETEGPIAVEYGASYSVASGAAQLLAQAEPAVPRDDVPPPAP